MYVQWICSQTAMTKTEKTKELEEMSDKELMYLHDGIMDIRCYLDRRLASVTAIMHERLEKKLVK